MTALLLDEGPVLLVTHDEDGAWQFLDGDDCTEDDAALLALEDMINHDPTLIELAALPIGYCAARQSIDAPWRVGYHGDDDEPDEETPDLRITS